MCRWIAYCGEPLAIDEVVTKPCRSLIHQSIHAHEAKTGTNGDGFGLGWYGERETPGLYRDLRPAWSDENLLSLCHQVRSRLFFAHVRASTGTATARANCHPFTHGRMMFMHNGQVGCYGQLRRRLEAMIPDTLYGHRAGTTDSEVLFLLAVARQALTRPAEAMASVLGDVLALMAERPGCDPLRFTAALADGDRVTAFRWASDGKAPTLYYRRTEGGTLVVSEPLDDSRAHWQPVPQDSCLTVDREGLAITPFLPGIRLNAAQAA